MVTRTPPVSDAYATLGVPSTASPDEVRRAFWERSAALDAGADGAREELARLTTAYELLADPEARAAYDAQRDEPASTATPETGGVPPESPTGPRVRRRRRWPWVVGAIAALLVVVIVAGFVVRLPKRIIRPGSATPVDDVVRIEGVQSYQPDGDLLFLTVKISNDRPSVWETVVAELDDDAEVLDEREVIGDLTPEEERRLSEMEMEQSQLTAKSVALEYLGYPVERTGKGAVVVEAVPDGPSAGKLAAGDVITAIDGNPVTLAEDVGELVRAQPPGSELEIDYTRDGATRSAEVTTAERDGAAFLGVRLATQDLDVTFPFEVRIDPGAVRGPSAGLAFTLAIIDELTPGELTDGEKVAVTGTISLDGTVGLIGSARQKAVAASEAGAVLMLVPEGEEDEARAGARPGMEVVGVTDLKDALDALADAGGAEVKVPPGG